MRPVSNVPTIIALVVAAAVAIHATALRSSGLGDAEFVVCTVALSAALAVLAFGWRRVEGFADSAKSIVDDLLLPHLDRLVTGLDKGKFSGQIETNVEADHKHFGVAEGSPDGRKLVSEYRNIGNMLCRLSEIDPARFAKLLSSLGVPPPTFAPATTFAPSPKKKVSTPQPTTMVTTANASS